MYQTDLDATLILPVGDPRTKWRHTSALYFTSENVQTVSPCCTLQRAKRECCAQAAVENSLCSNWWSFFSRLVARELGGKKHQLVWVSEFGKLWLPLTDLVTLMWHSFTFHKENLKSCWHRSGTLKVTSNDFFLTSYSCGVSCVESSDVTKDRFVQTTRLTYSGYVF